MCAQLRKFLNFVTLDNVLKILQGFQPITLEQMDSVALLDRHDTKYILHLRDVVDMLPFLMSDYAVLEVNNFRMSPYESQYFDTEDLLFYTLHQRGKRNRLKVRIRKYGSTGASFLEAKFKTNTERTVKYRKPIADIRDYLTSDDLVFLGDNVGEQPKLIPTLFNAFDRITLANLATGERMTLDLNLRFRDADGQESHFDTLAIAELKQPVFDREATFARLAKERHIRPDSVSKYCLGIGMLNDAAKKNFINVKLRRIRKLETNHRL